MGQPSLVAMIAALGLVAAVTPDAEARELPATGLSYRIDVDLDPQSRAVAGTAEIRWRNDWVHPVSAVPIHLYLNAFAHERTTWVAGVPFRRFNVGEFLDVWEDPWGWIEPTSVRQRVGGEDFDASWRPLSPDDGNPFDRTLAFVSLPKPVPAGGELTLTVEWRSRMPIPIARTGCVGGYCLMAQWFPKLAVLEHWKDSEGAKGPGHPPWALRQFHGLTEFYSDFADYDVTITVPEGHLVGATGRAQDTPKPAEGASGKVSVRHVQRAVHDFAWVVGPDLAEATFPYTPAARGAVPVSVRYIVPRGLEHQIPRLRGAVEASLDTLGRRVGPYPYDVLTVIGPPAHGGRTGGMEYPTLITSVVADERWDRWPWHEVLLPELVAVHEFAHQYFYGLFANDERREAMLDEGFTSFWEGEIMAEAYGGRGGAFLGRPIEVAGFRSLRLEGAADRIRQPMAAQPSFLFDPRNAGAQFYSRPSVTLSTAQAYRSPMVTDMVFKTWYRRRAFTHPTLDEFFADAASGGGGDLEIFLREAFGKPEIPNFKVAKAKVKRWKAPRGHVVTEDGAVDVTEETRDDGGEHAEVGLDAAAREESGRMLVEIADPGWYRGAGRRAEGAVVRRLDDVVLADPDADFEPDGAFHESVVRVEGPAWDHLPVDVAFRFADGAVVQDVWDGKAPWRRYRFLRKAPLRTVRVDPAGKAKVDVRPQDDGMHVRPDPRTKTDWGNWLGALAQWLAVGLTLWL